MLVDLRLWSSPNGHRCDFLIGRVGADADGNCPACQSEPCADCPLAIALDRAVACQCTAFTRLRLRVPAGR